jgi:hypothetical protein
MRLDGKALKTGSVPVDRLEQSALLDKFLVVSWGDPAVVDPTSQTIELQLVDLAGEVVEAAHVLRVTCNDKATMAVGESGTALSGDESADVIVQTDETGLLQLVVTCEEEVEIEIAAGPTQLSPMLDCSAGATCSFIPE